MSTRRSLTMWRTVLIAALAVAAEGSSTNATADDGPELAIEFALADDEVVLHKVAGGEALFTCVKLTLHPEEGEQQWARAAKVQFPTELPAAAKVLPRAWRQPKIRSWPGQDPGLHLSRSESFSGRGG